MGSNPIAQRVKYLLVFNTGYLACQLARLLYARPRQVRFITRQGFSRTCDRLFTPNSPYAFCDTQSLWTVSLNKVKQEVTNFSPDIVIIDPFGVGENPHPNATYDGAWTLIGELQNRCGVIVWTSLSYRPKPVNKVITIQQGQTLPEVIDCALRLEKELPWLSRAYN